MILFRNVLFLIMLSGFPCLANDTTVEEQFNHLLRTNLNAALSWLDDNAHQFNEAQQHLHYATVNYRLGEPDKAMRHVTAGLNSAPDVAQKVLLLSLYASILKVEGDLEKTLVQLSEGIELARDNGLTSLLVVMLSNRAQRYADTGNLSLAFADLDEAEQYIDNVVTNIDLATFYNAVSATNSRAKNASAAIEAARKAIELVEAGQDIQQLSVLYYNLGHLFEEQGLFVSARQAYLDSLEYARESNDKLGVAYAEMGIGEMYLPKWRVMLSELKGEEEPDIAQALLYLQRAEQYFAQNADLPNRITVTAKMAFAFWLTEEYQAAFEAAQWVIQSASVTDLYIREALILAHRITYFVHLEKGQVTSAKSAFNHYDNLVHDYYQSIYLKQVADSAKSLELSLIAHEKEMLALQNKAQSEQIDGQKLQLEQYLTYLILAVMLCTMLGVSLFYNSKMRKKLARLAVTDELTQVANRRAIMGELDTAFRQSGDFSLAFIDIDFFKRINDTFGHQAGDLVLCQVADMLVKYLPENARLGRYGGEEFLCILPGRNIDEAGHILDNVRATISAAKIKNIRQNTLSVSIGVAQKSATDETYMQLLNRADEALYEAKENGRNQVRLAA